MNTAAVVVIIVIGGEEVQIIYAVIHVFCVLHSITFELPYSRQMCFVYGITVLIVTMIAIPVVTNTIPLNSYSLPLCCSSIRKYLIDQSTHFLSLTLSFILQHCLIQVILPLIY